MTITLVATCLVTSSNYVLNELLDAATDRLHPEKAIRPAAGGRVNRTIAFAEWIGLAVAGVALAGWVGAPVATVAALLWVMGILYNVPPVRLKDWPYLDVLSESLNNPLRLGLGWFPIVPARLPPVSLIIAFWMGGAFLMAVKRLAERREFGPDVALAYRRSLATYTEEALLVSSLFYATLSSLFAGMFILRYRLELVFLTPLLAGLFAYYLHIGFKPVSAARRPERLHREAGLFIDLCLCLVVFAILMFVTMPFLYRWFTIDPAGITPLWRLE